MLSILGSPPLQWRAWVVQERALPPHSFLLWTKKDTFEEFLTNVRACAERAGGPKTLIEYLRLMLSASNNDYSHCSA